MSDKKCSVGECSQKSYSCGLCRRHYRSQLLANPDRKECTVEGCHKKVLAKGFCGAHYKLWSKYGAPRKHSKYQDFLPLPNEVWKNIEGYDGKYQVSSLGRVRSYANFGAFEGEGKCTPIIKSHSIGKAGYHRVGLDIDGVTRLVSVHRLVAEAFIPNPNNKPQVNHIDGDKANNKKENLEWATAKENARHRVCILHKTPSGPPGRKVRCVETGEVFPSIAEAARSLGVNSAAVDRVVRCPKNTRTCKKLHWEFVDKQ